MDNLTAANSTFNRTMVVANDPASMQQDVMKILDFLLKLFSYIVASGLGFAAVMPLTYIINCQFWYTMGWQQTRFGSATKRALAGDGDFIAGWICWTAPYGISLWGCLWNFNLGPWQDAALACICIYVVYGAIMTIIMLIWSTLVGVPKLISHLTARSSNQKTKLSRPVVGSAEIVELMKGQEV